MAGIRQSMALSAEQVDELTEQFGLLDKDGTGYISMGELREALELVGHRLPAYQIRDLITQYDTNVKDDKIDFEEFKQMYARLKSEHDLGHKYKKAVSKREGVETLSGSHNAAEGTTHSVRKEEQVAFSNWINRNLEGDPDCKKYLPLVPESRDIYDRCKDGIILCKMINRSQPGTIDERAINKDKLSIYLIHENLTLALNSAQAIGCFVVNIGAEDLHTGRPHLLLGLLWQIIRIGLLSDINLHEHPGLVNLLMEGETLDEFKKLSPETILIRWVNYHLERSNCGRQISNLQSDIKDSVAYIHLIKQIAPKEKGVDVSCQNEHDLKERAEGMLQEADKINCRSFVSPTDVVNGNYKLNLAFVANMFNMYPALEVSDDIDIEDLVEETREEKTYRNWMNSLGVSPYVNHLYSDLSDGLVIFQLYDFIKPGIVNWSKVKKQFKPLSMMHEKIGNCNYAVELGKEIKFSLVGIGGSDIYHGNPTLTLALVWQLMKAYTLAVLTRLSTDNKPIIEKEIVTWANDKLKSSGKKTQITGFNDPTISDAKVLVDLLDAIKPGTIKYDLIKDGTSEQDRLDNAKYMISMARKVGVRVYALPEDIVEVKPKMVLTIFACLMTRDLQLMEKEKTQT